MTQRYTNLTELNIRDVCKRHGSFQTFYGHGLCSLTALSRLTHLQLRGWRAPKATRITYPELPLSQQFLQGLSTLPSLVSLDLSWSNWISRPQIQLIAQLTQLTHLRLSGCNWLYDWHTDTESIDTLSSLSSLTRLQRLNIDLEVSRDMHCNYVITDMRDLRGLSSLRCLHIGLGEPSHVVKAPVRDSLNFSFLSRLTELRALFEYAQPEFLMAPRGLPSLTALRLLDLDWQPEGGYSDAHMAAFACMTELTRLALCVRSDQAAYMESQVTDDGLRQLTALQALTSLVLSGCAWVTSEGIACLQALPQLVKLGLHLWHNTAKESRPESRRELWAHGLPAMAAFPSLARLSLHGCGLDGSDAVHVSLLTALDHLCLSETQVATIPDQFRTLTALRYLDLRRVLDGALPEGLSNLLALPRLSHLDLGSEQIPLDPASIAKAADRPSLHAVLVHMPSLRWVGMYGIPLSKGAQHGLPHITFSTEPAGGCWQPRNMESRPV
ncbi:hypothetical protein WJX72_004548 [[Myrmecia] bisecta]|uniref:Uncharacterized protein n=1 Tax=[Myrmecia] bisecta TaxID=41462 RepID=A0AAW1R6S0_9CHLO